jgi:hypothetical protein
MAVSWNFGFCLCFQLHPSTGSPPFAATKRPPGDFRRRQNQAQLKMKAPAPITITKAAIIQCLAVQLCMIIDGFHCKRFRCFPEIP